MMERKARVLLGLASALAAVGGAIHALAFKHVKEAVATSAMAPFFAGSFKGLWLADSATLFILAAMFAVAAAGRSSVRVMVMLAALIPATTAVMIYIFIGMFPAAHMLSAIAVLALAAGAFSSGTPGARVKNP